MLFLENKVKNRVKANRRVLGSWLNLPSLEIAEIMARSGFDFLVIDLEHSSISIETAQKMTMVIESCNCLPFIRVGENNPLLIKRALEMGCYGVVVPMINSKQDAQRAVDSIYYAPIGIRGTGLSRAQDYGAQFKRYKSWHRDNIAVVFQIEHIEAINNLEDILSVKKVDATIIGPYDLSSSLGCPGEFGKKEVASAIGKYTALCARHKKPKGIHVIAPNAKEAKKRLKEGFNFLVFSIDMLFLKDKITKELKDLR